MDDFKYTIRTLTRAPLFTGVALLTLALCIGANSAIFSVLNGILLKPYPWPSSERLVAVYNSYPLMGLQNAGVSIPDYLDRKAGVAGFEDAAMYTGMSFNLGGDGEPERIVGQRATPSLFTTLQSGAAIGRVFTAADAEPGSDRVVILSHALWRDRFGADRGVIGRTIQLNTLPYTIVGVMPDWFYFPSPRVQMWVPFAFTPQQKTDDERGNEFSSMIARLKPGALNAEITRDLDLIQSRNAERLTDSRDFFKTSGFGGRFNGFLEQNVGNIRAMLWLVQAAVVAALLIGCANVASLLLARAVGRERELAIRSAVGAARGRVMGLLLTESLVLFVAGGALGLLVAWWGLGALGSLGLQNLPRGFDVSLDTTVLGFTLLAALVTGIVFGALPAWSATRGDTASTLKESGNRGGSGRRTQFLRSGLVVTEIALAVMLLATAALLIRSFERMQREDPGFRADGVLTVQLSLPAARYDVPEKRVAFADALLSRVRALPGVTNAGLTSVLPFTGNNSSGSYSSPDIVVPPGAPAPHGFQRVVDPGYFQTLGIPLLKGRLFEPTDAATSQRVMIIDKLLSEKYWPGQDPIGKRINRFGSTDNVFTIVGVVAPIKMQSLEENVTKETLYYPYAQTPGTNMILTVKTPGDPALLTTAVRAAVREVDPDQPVFDIKPLRQRMDEQATSRRAPMTLISIFSLVALLLAAIGVYGVLAFAVAQRTAEFGVRVAMGADRSAIAGLVFRQAARLVGIGVTLGLAGYLAMSGLVGRLLFGVPATDPASLITAPVVIAISAFLACLLPVREATRISPLEALRVE